MKRKPTVLFLLSGLILNMSCSLNKIADVISPDGSNKFVFSIEPGEMSQNIASFYLEVGEKKVLLPSSLEIDLKENPLKRVLKLSELNQYLMIKPGSIPLEKGGKFLTDTTR